MTVEQKAFKKIDKICRDVLKITRTDINLIMKRAIKQAQYTHPLKGATQKRVNNAGEGNVVTLNALETFRYTVDFYKKKNLNHANRTKQ